MEPIIKLKNVKWQREGKKILDDVNWEVNSKEHWAILGLNGSGKTTLLNMINGYIWPSEGEMEVLGCTFGKTDIRELRKRIGWVSSSLSARIQGTTDTQDVVVSGKFASVGLYDMPTERDFEKAFALMERIGVRHLIGRSYETCSQGEQQKLLIARGLMADPELLILDEPTNGLDFLSREELMKTINELARSEKAPTIILVTHHIEEILPVFSHTLLLRGGEVYAQGANEDVLKEESLSDFFNYPVSVEWQEGRAWLKVK
ncbi:ABC transporter ATP-binding protein [Aciduricibacillus chroicocephali]|uniref:ABC transporter ATP-binding protein n=1 Tax=Aciduricibacillus chroicocephali TaxID=3054939 RepID=A0ABY9KTK1_9BACI|nr:ABC transporter ATP-binding protein [Bacillaceae bacterium 44XB]